jgi:phosphatidylglycerophosphate synthase
MLLDDFRDYVKLRDWKDQILKPLVNITPDWLTPNRITGLRFILSPVFFYFWWQASNPYFVWQSYYWGIIISLAVFAYFTDLWDGAVARLKDRITVFGIYFDPITDKIYSVGFLLLLAWQWPDISSFYWLINVRVFLILFSLARAAFHEKGRVYTLLCNAYMIMSFIGYSIFAVIFIRELLML